MYRVRQKSNPLKIFAINRLEFQCEILRKNLSGAAPPRTPLGSLQLSPFSIYLVRWGLLPLHINPSPPSAVQASLPAILLAPQFRFFSKKYALVSVQTLLNGAERECKRSVLVVRTLT